MYRILILLFISTVAIGQQVKVDLNQIDKSGNAAFDDSTLVIDAVNNRVGIGTSTPGDKLSVEGRVRSTATGYDAGLLAINTNASNQNWFVGTYDDGKLIFRDGNAASTKMVIENATGNVGIGTTTPSQKLDVIDLSTFSAILVKGINGNIASSYKLQHGGGGGRLETDGTWSISYGSAETNFGLTPNLGGGLVFLFESGSTYVTPMTLKRNGNALFSSNVGIGTTSPSYPLDVNGDVNSEIKYIKLTKTTNPQLTQGTAVNLTWETQQVYDTDVFTHTPGGNTVTVDKAGVYMIIANVNYYSTGADRSTIITTIATSAGVETGSSAQTYIRNNSGNSYANGRAQTMVSLSPGDIIYVNVYPLVIAATAATYVQGVRSELLIYRMGY